MIPQPTIAAASTRARTRGTYLSYAAFVALLCLTGLVYLPGLRGPFLFDDYPNLERIGSRGPIESFELLWFYLSSGFSGPTGRPLSLLSFLIDANNWPAEAFPFKRTNLLLHLLVGAMLFGTTRKLLTSIGRSALDASWIAALAAGLWLLNPFLVSTTLYAVQRMTQLAALFVLAGIWCYLHGRAQLATNERRGYVTLCVGLPLFTLLAVVSKENGALLPLLVLVLQLALQARWTTPNPARWWTTVWLVLPSAGIIGYLLSIIPSAERLYSARDFTMYERLLSQCRFLWDYLYHLFIPHIQTQGLFQDGRTASTGLLEPWTTLPSLLALVAVALFSWRARAKWPLWSLAGLFFLAGHSLESTTIALELYFEHRNYLPAAFLFLPISTVAYDALQKRARRTLAAAAILGLTSSYALATWQHAKLWGNEDQLLLVWANQNPTSVRAAVSASQVWVRNNDSQRALALLEDADRRLPGNALLISSILMARAELGVLTVADLEDGARRIRAGTFDVQAVRALEQLVRLVNSAAPAPEHTKVLVDLLQGIRDDLAGSIPPADRMTTYLQGLLLAGQDRPDEAKPYLMKAVELYGNIDSGLRIVSDMALFGHFELALEILSRCEALLADTDDSALRLPRQTYQADVDRLRTNLLLDIEAKGEPRVSSLPQTADGATHRE